jgi:hypothetical protein
MNEAKGTLQVDDEDDQRDIFATSQVSPKANTSGFPMIP